MDVKVPVLFLAKRALAEGPKEAAPVVIRPQGGAGAGVPLPNAAKRAVKEGKPEMASPDSIPQAASGTDETGKVLDTCGPQVWSWSIGERHPSPRPLLLRRESRRHIPQRARVAPHVSGRARGLCRFCVPHCIRPHLPAARHDTPSSSASASPQRHYLCSGGPGQSSYATQESANGEGKLWEPSNVLS